MLGRKANPILTCAEKTIRSDVFILFQTQRGFKLREAPHKVGRKRRPAPSFLGEAIQLGVGGYEPLPQSMLHGERSERNYSTRVPESAVANLSIPQEPSPGTPMSRTPQGASQGDSGQAAPRRHRASEPFPSSSQTKVSSVSGTK